MEKINELIQQQLSIILHEIIREENPQIFLTVQEVQTANDIKTAKVWVSVFSLKLSDADKEKMIHKIQKKAPFIQHKLLHRIDLKFIPKLTFKLDKNLEAIEKIDEVLDSLKK
jgi:ribosome-binding factor A